MMHDSIYGLKAKPSKKIIEISLFPSFFITKSLIFQLSQKHDSSFKAQDGNHAFDSHNRGTSETSTPLNPSILLISVFNISTFAKYDFFFKAHHRNLEDDLGVITNELEAMNMQVEEWIQPLATPSILLIIKAKAKVNN